jgi:hypothetical protein
LTGNLSAQPLLADDNGCGMSTRLDVRLAVREANGVFLRSPVLVCLPMMVAMVASTCATLLMQRVHSTPGVMILYSLLTLVVAYGLFWVISLVEVGVAAMFLRQREGGEPALDQIGEGLRRPRFASVVWDLTVRYIGWALVICIPLGIVGLIASLSTDFARQGGVPGRGAGLHFGLEVVGGIICSLLLYRYMFVLPMFAIARGAGPGFFDECVRRAKQDRKTAILIFLAQYAPSFLFTGIGYLMWGQKWRLHGGHVGVQLAEAAVVACIETWFILLRTGLAMQLVAMRLPPELPPEPMGLGNGVVF